MLKSQKNKQTLNMSKNSPPPSPFNSFTSSFSSFTYCLLFQDSLFLYFHSNSSLTLKTLSPSFITPTSLYQTLNAHL